MTNTIAVKYWGELAQVTKLAEEGVNAANVKDVLSHIKAKYGGKAAKTAETMLIALNGRNILRMNLFRTALNAGDVLCFYPICAGG